MEKKNRGTYKVDMTKTPKENVVLLLKMTFPIETTLAKMANTLDANTETLPWQFRSKTALMLNEVSIFPASKNRWSECVETKDFQRVIFTTKTPSGRTYRRSMLRSVPVVKGKVSLTKVTRLITEFSEFNKQFIKEEEERRLTEIERFKIRAVRTKELNDLKAVTNLPSQSANIDHNSYGGDSKTYSVHIENLNEEQVIEISKAIREMLAKTKGIKGEEK